MHSGAEYLLLPLVQRDEKEKMEREKSGGKRFLIIYYILLI